MQMTITRRHTIQSAHWLPEVPEDHKCRKLHGHTYHVEVVVQGEVDPKLGWFMDFAELDAAWCETCKRKFDHVLLNDVITNPTTENLCAMIWARLEEKVPGLAGVGISENPKSQVWLRR